MEEGVKQGCSRKFRFLHCLCIFGAIAFCSLLIASNLPSCHNHEGRGRVEGFLAELEAGLDRFEIDNGYYPENPPTGSDPVSRDKDGLRGSAILYEYLSGDKNLDGKVFDTEGKRDPGDEQWPIYVRKLDWESNQDLKEKRVVKNPDGPGYLVIDPYGKPVRYLAEPVLKREKLTRNPTYDIWSIEKTKPSQADDPKTRIKYITNWRRN